MRVVNAAQPVDAYVHVDLLIPSYSCQLQDGNQRCANQFKVGEGHIASVVLKRLENRLQLPLCSAEIAGRG